MATWCDECDNVCAETKTKEPWNWRCISVPIKAGYGFVSRNYAPYPPYMQCSRVNTEGACPFYERSRGVIDGNGPAIESVEGDTRSPERG